MYWSAHTHSKYSARDALPTVQEIVNKAAEFNYPAIGLTDHGTMAGAAQLYVAARKNGIEPLPGIEAYIAINKNETRPSTMHMGLLATNAKGYRNLVSLVSQSHQQFKYKPILDLSDLAQAAEDGRLDGVAAMTGCWFGLLPTLLREGHTASVKNVLGAMDSWFGSGLYVEIQNHQIIDKTHDDEAHTRVLHAIAKSMGLPTILTQDSHYIELEDRKAHETMKRLTSWSEDPDDAVFPGDGYHMVDTEWMKDHHAPDIFEYGMEGLNDLLSKAQVVIPELDTFQLKVPDTTVSGDPDKELLLKASESLQERIDNGSIKKADADAYWNRVTEELEVVMEAGFSGYLLFTATVCDWMTKENIAYNVRGSASGSLVCWLIGITSFDAISWGLRFDRFLSKDRTKPPDIDIDVEHEKREAVLDWLRQSYHVVNISTWLQMGMQEQDGEQKGSLLVRWKMHARKTGRDPNAPLSKQELIDLRELAKKAPYQGYGVHAAGLLIAPDAETAGVVPLQYVASSKTMVTAFDKDDVERLGLVKLDVLGLKTLSAIKIMQELTGIKYNEIPLNDKKVFQMLSKGETAGLFQLEGHTARNGVKRLKPTKITDVIAAMALFRPATMDSGATDEYINRRQKTAKVPVRHPIIENETKDTYGVLLFQEQAIGVLRAVGLDPEEIETARKAIKASNADVGGARGEMQTILKRVRTLAKEKGMGLEDLAWLEKALEAYAGYGFNKAHATAYGVVAYVTAWYSLHHPVAFWAGMLKSYTGAKQENEYLKSARAAGVQIRPPHVNRSKEGYTADLEQNAIRKGLLAIKGLGEKAALDLITHAPYASLDDLARKVSAKRVTGAKSLGLGHSPQSCGGVITHLHESNALDGLGRENE